ncbi:MAG: hypothetical protein IIY33_00655 [Erysipelotrichaceae bacterium]|nr:hypothetical protein [Erysipelotrichaceae bacterium]
MISARHWHKTVCLIMALLLICMLAGCTQKQKEEEPTPSEQPSQTNEETETPDKQEETEKMLKLYIDEQEITVTWETNESVKALSELAEKGSVNITTSRYGGFEQVGPIGQSLPRHDVQTETGQGDIVLYSGNQIVVFYGTNSWSYTRLGHIENMSVQELTQLLNKNNVSLRLSVEK